MSISSISLRYCWGLKGDWISLGVWESPDWNFLCCSSGGDVRESNLTTSTALRLQRHASVTRRNILMVIFTNCENNLSFYVLRRKGGYVFTVV